MSSSFREDAVITIKTKIPVTVHVYFVAMAALFIAAGTAEFLLMGLGFALLHELGHLAALALCGGRPSRVCLTAAGMRIERPPGLALGFRQEILIALAGPAVSLALAGLCALLHLALPARVSTAPALMNLGFGLFNLLPVRELDGGRALFYALSRRMQEPAACKIIQIVSLACLFLAAFLAGLVCMRVGFHLSLAVVVIYLAVCV